MSATSGPTRSGHRRAPPPTSSRTCVGCCRSEPDPEWVAELARKAVRWGRDPSRHRTEDQGRPAAVDNSTGSPASKPTPFAPLSSDGSRWIPCDEHEPAIRAIGVVARGQHGYDARPTRCRRGRSARRSESSSSRCLPTPRDSQVRREPHRPDADALSRALADLPVLPTPVADNSRGLPSASTDYASLANVAASLLPTPTTQPNRQWSRPQSGKEAQLLPTPAVNDMGAGKTVDEWDAWTERMKTAHGNGNGHGKSPASRLPDSCPRHRSRTAWAVT